MKKEIPLNEAPYFLIAMPQLLDPNFAQTVVLVFNASKDGILGLILNRPAPASLEHLTIPDISIDPALQGGAVWYGGPCEPNRIWLLHEMKHPSPSDSMPIAGGIYLGAAFHLLDVKSGESRLKPEEFKLFSGYSAWQPGQLEQEMQLASWLVAPVDRALLLKTPPEKIWSEGVRGLGIDPSQLATETSSSIQ